MQKLMLVFICVLIGCSDCYCQDKSLPSNSTVPDTVSLTEEDDDGWSKISRRRARSKESQKKEVSENGSQDPDGTTPADENFWQNRLSFVFGGGPGLIWGRVFDHPFADRVNGNVHIAKNDFSDKLMGSLSLGVGYTFFNRAYTTYVPTVDKDMRIINRKMVDYRPSGPSAILMLNPLTLTGSSFNSGSKANVGVGFGLRSGGGFACYLTFDIFGIRQPRQSFVEYYWHGDKPYKINEDVQFSFDSNDENLFRTKHYGVVGFKLMFALDVFNKFKTLAQTIQSQQATEQEGQ